MKILQMPTATLTRRRALCIGIDSYTRAPLRGAVSDAERWAEVLEGRGFGITLLRNEEATRERVLEELWMHVEYARPGDRIAVAFAGHGTRDVGRTDDTAIVCADADDGGIVLDDEIGEAMSHIVPGVNVTLFFDCCHSGTMSRTVSESPAFADAALRERQVATDRVLRAAFDRLCRVRRRAVAPGVRGRSGRTRRCVRRYGRALGAALLMREVCIAACGDQELAYEVGGAGVFTAAATALLEEHGDTLWTNRGFVGALEVRMRRVLRQRPRLTCAPWRQHEALLGESARRRAA